MLKYYPTKLNKDEVFDSVKEMSNYCNIMNRIHRLSNFLSTKLLIESYFASLENYVERSAAFLNKNPKLATKISLKQQIYLAPWKMPISFTYNPNSKLFFKTADQNRKLIAAMKQHPLPLIKADGALLELYANLYRNNFSVAKFKRNLTKYFKYIAPLLPASHASRRTIYLWCRWQYLKSDLQTPPRHELRKALIEQSVVFMYKRNWCNINDLFAYISYATKNREEFLKRVLVLRKYKKLKNISSSNTSHVYRRLKMYMQKIKPVLIGFDKTPLYNELEAAVGIKTKMSAAPIVHCLLPHRSEFWRQKNGNDKIIAAEKHGNDLYFCFSDLKRIKGPEPFKFYISLAVFNLKNKWGNKLSSYEGLFHNSRSRVFYNSLIYREKFYLACREGVLVFPLDGSSPYLIDKLPGKYVYTIAGLDNRIYIAVEGKPLSDNNKPPIQTVLLSCKPDGSDRKIIFSSRDRAKRNFFDRDKPFKIEYIWGDEQKKRLLMIAGKPLGGLWEFYPQSGKYKNLCRLTPFEFGWGKFINNRLYFSMRSNVFFEYNPERDRTRFILSRSKYYRNLAQKYSGLKPEYEIKSFGADNFYRTDNWIWLANDWDMCRIDMNIPSNLTRLPRVRNNGSEFIMLPWDKGKAMIAVSSREIFYLGEKTSSFKQKINPEIFKTPLVKNLGL